MNLKRLYLLIFLVLTIIVTTGCGLSQTVTATNAEAPPTQVDVDQPNGKKPLILNGVDPIGYDTYLKCFNDESSDEDIILVFVGWRTNSDSRDLQTQGLDCKVAAWQGVDTDGDGRKDCSPDKEVCKKEQ